MIKQYVEIKTDFDALHHWPECPFEDVQFLKNLHRHKIYVVVKIKTSEDRQIEFFQLKYEVEEYVDELFGKDKLKNLGRMSMEEISTKIINKLTEKYNTEIEVSSSEDGQVRGIVNYAPEKRTS